MDPQILFCPNLACVARGQAGKGNIHRHSQKEKRYQCSVCAQTFSTRKGTPLYRCRVAEEVITLVLTLLSHGCPIPAIVAGLGFQARTVRRWVEKAGAQCEAVHHPLVAQPRDLVQVQADEIRVKTQQGVVWMALALMVPARLWLGGVLSPSRDKHLVRALAALVRVCALPRPLLVAADGFCAYVAAFAQALRSPEHTGGRGHPPLVAWKDIVIGQVVKQCQKRRIVGVVRRLAQGTQPLLEHLIIASQGAGVLNTAFVERLNATFRARLATLVRKTRGLARRQERLYLGMYLVGTAYNFCTGHESLTLEDKTVRTPAMAAGITDHCWSMSELLWYRVPPQRWQPPKKRGRKSKALRALIERWAT